VSQSRGRGRQPEGGEGVGKMRDELVRLRGKMFDTIVFRLRHRKNGKGRKIRTGREGKQEKRRREEKRRPTREVSSVRFYGTIYGLGCRSS